MPTRFTSKQLRDFLNTSQGKTYTVGFLTGALVLILLAFVLLPSVGSIFTQITENSEREVALNALKAKNAIIRTLISQEQENRAVSVALTKTLPDGLKQAEIIENIINFSLDSNIKLSGISFKDMDLKKPPFANFPFESVDGKKISINAIGRRSDLETFLRQLESSVAIFTVSSMSLYPNIQVNGGTDSNYPYQISVEVYSYFWKNSNSI